tara:strand:+ start:38665 stop:38958 length:294 start_codon:yes stop_codon:yes gene_type:complete
LNNYYEKTNLFILPILILACGGTDGVGNLSVYLPILDIQYTTGITETTTTAMLGLIAQSRDLCMQQQYSPRPMGLEVFKMGMELAAMDGIGVQQTAK